MLKEKKNSAKMWVTGSWVDMLDVKAENLYAHDFVEPADQRDPFSNHDLHVK